MLLKEIINKSIYGTIGYISSQDDLDRLESYILYNLPIIKEYKKVIVATNFSSPLQEENKNLWKKYFPECTLLDSPLNRGHNHGYADLDNLLFDWCKENNEEWLCKGANDIILQPKILNLPIQESDFYYLNGIGYGRMVKYDFDNNRIINEDFFPQTNFYFINVSKTDYLNNKEYLNKTYDEVQNISNYNGKIWEYIKGWECEGFLKQCINRNDLLKYHLVSDEKYLTLLQHVKNNHIHDSSHKNIMIEGICHYHFYLRSVTQI